LIALYSAYASREIPPRSLVASFEALGD